MNFWRKTEKKQKKESPTKPEKQDPTFGSPEHRLIHLRGLFEAELPNLTKTQINVSRPNQQLLDILHDKSALSYFIQYLESRNALPYIKLWLDIESYSASCKDDDATQILSKYSNIIPEGLKELSKIQDYVVDLLVKDYFLEFSRSEYFVKHQIQVLTSGNLRLQDVVYNETALFYFMEFMEQEQYRDILEFWITIQNFKSTTVTQSDALLIYDKYFSLQATNPLGFPDSLRFEIEENICSDCISTAFDKPLQLTQLVLNRFLILFQSSELFYKYLSELVTTPRHRRSDSGSDISSCNTLLAMPRPKKNGVMSIDTKDLYDPDSLWKRKSLGLELGRVTELGRFETGIEPVRKVDSKFGAVVKKFFQEDKDKEDMAWQVAEMIVKDITSLTLNESPPLTPVD